MNPQALIFLIAGLVAGGVVSALVTALLASSKNVQAMSDLKRQRDSALQSVADRDAVVAGLKQNIKTITDSGEAKAIRINALEAEKGRLRGELTTVEALREQAALKDKRIIALNDRVVHLESSRAELEQRARSTEISKQEALGEKQRSLQSTLDAQAEGFRLRLREKELALQGLMGEKDKAIEQQKKLLADTERLLTEKFGALSLTALKSAGEDFLRLANERFDKAGEVSKAELEKRQQAIDELLKPVAETLDKLGKQHQEIEERRVSAFDSIEKGIKTLSSEADQLANALRKPTSRGAWGEMNLQVILENAGLVQGEHFIMQDSTSDDEDGVARTDVVVNLPSGRHLIIDSKAPLEACWEGMNATDETVKRERFAAHARLVRDHVKKLSSKTYWSRYTSAPDFTIMFVPTEGAYQAAIEADRTLIGDAQKSKIYITSPMTLMSMVHAIAFILREEKLAQNAQEVQDTAAELYKRLAKFLEHVEKLGRNLRLSVDSYNNAVGSLDGRVLPTARRMNAMGIGGGADLPDVPPIEAVPRTLVSQDHLLLPFEAILDLSPGDPAPPPRI